MSLRISTIALGVLTGVAPLACAGSLVPLSGAIFGEVQSHGGVAQMGAAVSLFNRYDQLVRQGLTNQTGRFIFDALPPGDYSIRVVLASFVPAVRRHIAIAPGSENLLKINLASVLSTIDLVPSSSARGTLMSDDWKWVLRTSGATRPVLRLLPVSSTSHSPSTSIFSETSGVVRLSGGDADALSGGTTQDMGTAFAVATVVNGSARVLLSGDVGYMASSGLPTAGFRATYAQQKDGASGPQASLTVHQIYFPGLAGSENPSADSFGQPAGPALRTVSFGASDKLDVTEHLRLEYGGHMDSVVFLNRENYLSPFARATYDLPVGALRFAFSSGTEPAELIANEDEAQSTDLNRDLSQLSQLPQLSRSGGRLRIERTANLEAGYQVARGSRKYYAGAYREQVADAAFTLSGASFLPGNDLLPTIDGSNYIYDAGNYQRTGFTAAVTQSAGNHVEFTAAAGRSGALEMNPVAENVPGHLAMRDRNRPWATARVSVVIPGAGTHIVGSYGWTDFQTLMPVHLSLTGVTYQDEGLNIRLRQPLPKFNGMRGRVEATAEIQNALAQGYLPVIVGGQPAVLTALPRALRGGLCFLF